MKRLIIIVLLISLPARAEDLCDPGLSNVELAACLYAAYERADKRMNEIWRDLAADRMSRDEQRAWVAYRDATCDREMVIGGDKAPVRRARCLREMTEDRIEQLERDRK